MTTTLPSADFHLEQIQKRRLRAHFNLSRMPFSKASLVAQMFDSQSQRELFDGLCLWVELSGITFLNGASGVGKSITLRRFVSCLDQSRYRVFEFAYLPSTVLGFLRSLNRILGLSMRLHATDLFDQAQSYLGSFQKDQGPHPILLIDDAEGLSLPILDLLRRLTCFELDAEDRFALILSGTDELLTTLKNPSLAPLCSRISYAHALRPFALEDTRNYIAHHLRRADANPKLFSDDAVRRIFQASCGKPRSINQLATQALIQAAVVGREAIDGEFMSKLIIDHPLYQLQGDR